MSSFNPFLSRVLRLPLQAVVLSYFVPFSVLPDLYSSGPDGASTFMMSN